MQETIGTSCRGAPQCRAPGPTGRAVLLLLVLAGACQPQAPGPARVQSPETTDAAEIPFRLAGPGGAVLLVSAHVNGHGPLDFVFDTGATLTCIDRDLAERLELEPAPAAAVGAGATAAGQVEVVRIDSLRIGETSAHDLLGCALDLHHLRQLPGIDIDGLIGLNFMRSFRVVLDFEREVLRLEGSD